MLTFNVSTARLGKRSWVQATHLHACSADMYLLAQLAPRLLLVFSSWQPKLEAKCLGEQTGRTALHFGGQR